MSRFQILAAQSKVQAKEVITLASELLDLLASLRLSSLAAGFAARVSRCARAHGDASTAVQAHILGLVYQVDSVQLILRSLRLPIAPIAPPSSLCGPVSRAALTTATLLQDAATRARALGQAPLSWRAQYAAEVLRFSAGSSNVRALRHVVGEWQRSATDCAHRSEMRDSEHAMGWVDLASRVAGDGDVVTYGLQQVLDAKSSHQALLLLAAHSWISGRPAAAMEHYVAYAAASVATVESAERLCSSGLPALAELVLARVGTPEHAPATDEIRNVIAFLSMAILAGPAGRMTTLAAASGLSLRRVQQSFSGCGLSAPAAFLRSFWAR